MPRSVEVYIYTDSVLNTFVDRADAHDFPPDFRQDYSSRFHEVPEILLTEYETALENLRVAIDAINGYIKTGLL